MLLDEPPRVDDEDYDLDLVVELEGNGGLLLETGMTVMPDMH